MCAPHQHTPVLTHVPNQTCTQFSSLQFTIRTSSSCINSLTWMKYHNYTSSNHIQSLQKHHMWPSESAVVSTNRSSCIYHPAEDCLWQQTAVRAFPVRIPSCTAASSVQEGTTPVIPATAWGLLKLPLHRWPEAVHTERSDKIEGHSWGVYSAHCWESHTGYQRWNSANSFRKQPRASPMRGCPITHVCLTSIWRQPVLLQGSR